MKATIIISAIVLSVPLSLMAFLWTGAPADWVHFVVSPGSFVAIKLIPVLGPPAAGLSGVVSWYFRLVFIALLFNTPVYAGILYWILGKISRNPIGAKKLRTS